MNDQKPTDVEKKKRAMMTHMLSFTTEFAVILAVPLLIGIYLGKYLDQRSDTHYYVLIGILVALAISSSWIYKRLKTLNDQLNKK